MLQDEFESAIKDAIADQVQPLLQDVLGYLDLSLPFEIPPFLPGAQPVTISLRAKPKSVAFVPNKSMTVMMDGTAHAPPGSPYDTLGTPGYANCLASPASRLATCPAWSMVCCRSTPETVSRARREKGG